MCKLAGSIGIVRNEITITTDLVLIGHKSFEADRSSGVKLTGADAYLCAESISQTIREACGAVPESITGIHAVQKFFRHFFVGSNDRVSMAGTICIDMADRFIKT